MQSKKNRDFIGLSVPNKMNGVIEKLFKCEMLRDASSALLSLANLGKKAAEMKKESPTKEISEYIFKHSWYFWHKQMWHELGIHTIDQCEIVARAIREELWDIAESSIDYIENKYIEAIIRNDANGFAFGLGNDLLISGAWALIKQKDDYVEKFKGKNRTLESLIGRTKFKGICVNSIELNKKNEVLKKGIENFIKAYDPNLLGGK